MKENDKFVLLAGIANLLVVSIMFYSIIMLVTHYEHPSILIVQTLFLFFVILMSGISYSNFIDFFSKDYESIEGIVSEIIYVKGYTNIKLSNRKVLLNPSIFFRPDYFDIEVNKRYRFVYGSRGKVIVGVDKIK